MLPLVALAGSLIQAAPMIAKWIGGEKAENAAVDVLNIAKAVTGAGLNEDAVKVILVDQDKARAFQEALANREADLDKAYLADTQSARERDIELAKVGMRNVRANILTTAAFALVGACMATVIWSWQLDESAKSVIILILGRAVGWVEQVFSFEFGTTRSSRTKDDTINSLTK